MRILICYFSGTGNTEKVVRAYEEQFKVKGHEIELWKVETKPFEKDLSSFDSIGFAYPVHAFNAPPIIINFAKALPKLAEKKPFFILNTSGEPLKLNNLSSLKLRKILKKKNFVFTNEYHYCMPYNMIFRHSNAMAYRMWDTAQKLIPIDCEEMLSGKHSKLGYVFMGSFIAWLMRIEHWGGKVNGKHYKVNEKCINCGRCIRCCPTNNIKIEDGKFVFGDKCIMCMRCSFFCPTDAFKIGWFNSWKVNGPYNFNDPNNYEQKSHKNWCKKSYNKYFARCEKKIKEYGDNNE